MSKTVKRVRRRRVKGTRSFAFQPPRPGLLAGGIIGGLILFVLLLIYAPKVYRSWSEKRLLQRAITLLHEGKLSEATVTAREAVDRNAQSLPAYYLLAEATEKQNDVETVAYRAQIARLLPNDLDSQLNLASAALRFGQLDVARQALERVPPANREKASFQVVAGWLARAQGNDAEVEDRFAAAVAQEPKNDLYQFNLAVIQIHSPNDEKNMHARDELDRLSKLREFRTGALRALLTDAIERNNMPAADGYAQQLQMSPDVTFADYLLALDFYQKLDPKKFNALLAKVKPVAARHPQDLAALMDWMNERKLAPEVLKWMESLKPEETTAPPAAVSVAEALVTVKNWSRLKRWTRSGDWGEAEYLRLAYQAYAARQAKGNAAAAEFEALWNSAARAAEGSTGRAAHLARLADKWGLAADSEPLWLELANHPPRRREALDALAQIYRARNDLPHLLQILQRLHESSPNEVGLAADSARLALLIERGAAGAQRLARETYDKAPNDLNAGVTYAFSLYGLGRTGEGIDILKKFSGEQLHDPHAAVFTAILLLDEGQLDLAREFIEAARKGPLYPEEKRLLEEARARAKGDASPSPSPT